MLETVVHRVVAPPPVNASVGASASSPTALASQLIASTGTTGSLRTALPTRQRCVTCHSALPLICFTLDVVKEPLSPHRQLVVQDLNTRHVVWKCSMREVAMELFSLDDTSTKLQAALKSLGRVQRVHFFDPSTVALQNSEYSDWFQHVVIQLHQRVVIWNIRTHKLVRQLTQADFSSIHPTTSMVALTTCIWTIGCADGSFRVYDANSNKVLKIARAGASKADPLWDVLDVTSYLDSCNNTTSIRTARILVLNRKGGAVVWELVVDVGGNALVEIRSPLARLEGQLAATTLSTGGDVRSDSTTASAVADGMADAAASSLEHTFVDFDGHRNYITWFIPSGYKGTVRPHVLIWDLKTIAMGASSRSKTPKPEPCVVSFPTTEMIQPMTLLAGWFHPSFSSADFLCAIVTQNGELHVLGVPMSATSPGRVVPATPACSFHIPNLLLLPDSGVPPPKLHLYALTALRRTDPSTLVVVTDMGALLTRIQESVATGGARHVHFSNLADRSRSVLMVHSDSTIAWGQLQVPHKNPHGVAHVKNPRVIHGMPPSNALPLSPEAQRQPQVVGPSPVLLPSPSGRFLCIFWQEEERYEILHMASLLRRNDGSTYSASVSSGVDIASFAWVGDDDVFAVLRPSFFQRDGASRGRTDSFRTATTIASKDSGPGVSGGGNSKKNSLRKKFDFARKGSISSSPLGLAGKAKSPGSINEAEYSIDTPRQEPLVELRTLIRVTANAAEMSGSISAATEITLGNITLRGGNRSPPTALFGGPVLCVVCSGDGHKDEGVAYFYTRKDDTDDNRAVGYLSSGPTIPSPDLVEWDDDGRLCAVIVESRVSVFLSDPPHFVLLGNVQLGSPSEINGAVIGAKFIGGVLYCTTTTSIQCIFLGSLESDICYLDVFVLASAGPSGVRPHTTGLAPPPAVMTLTRPIVLGYQCGSLLVSTSTGLQFLSLDNPMFRVGSLLAAGHPERAKRWFHLIPRCDHETFASFLGRRGVPELALELPGLPVEATVDICLRYRLTGCLEAAIEEHGIQSIRSVDRGIGAGRSDGPHSLVVCVGAYLLSQGKFELARRLATESLQCGKEGRNDALVLAGLFMSVDSSDARRLLIRSLGAKSERIGPSADDATPVMTLVLDRILQ